MRTALLITAFMVFAAPAAASAQDRPLTYQGYECTADCSGHRAGYAWAEKKGITSHDQCGGRSRSFIEGCHSWVESQKEETGLPPDENDAPADEDAPPER